jgi:peptide/nickel transport system permease protein
MKHKLPVRLLEYALTIWIITSLNFLLPRMIPGDPFLTLSSDSAEDEEIILTAEQRAYYNKYYGLDKTLGEQYIDYYKELFKGNFGYSLTYKDSVSSIIMRRLPWTAFMVLSSVILSTIIGAILGVISAWYRNRWPDKLLYIQSILLSEMPSFLLGLILLFVFAASLKLFPLSGALTPFAKYANIGEKITDIIKHAVLPVTALTITQLGGMYLLSRNSVIAVLKKDYVRTAEAKGLPKRRVMSRHIFRNAMLPIVTRVFISLGSLVGGAVLVESVFAYPGLGQLMKQSVRMHDYPVIQGIFLVVTIFVMLANMLADLVYSKLDPRISSEEGG